METAGRGRSLGKLDFDGKGVEEANASEGGGVTGCCSCGWRETRVFVPRSKGKKGSREKGAESPPEPAKSVSKSEGVGGRARVGMDGGRGASSLRRQRSEGGVQTKVSVRSRGSSHRFSGIFTTRVGNKVIC